MPSLIDEHQPFIGTDGKPIVNGKIYIGTQNQDPVSNTITIYSDRSLTVAIANPQSTDSYGRATNKIWVPGKYSIRVDDSADVQQYQELDAGVLSETGITNLINVVGTDTITANGSPAVLTLGDNQQYNFRAANTNTGSVTLQIDLTTAKTIKKQHDVDLVSGDIEQDQTVSVIYNATDDTFELVSNVSLGSTVDFDVTNDLTVGNDATVSGDIIYGGEIQPAIPAQVADHTRAGFTQLWSGEETGYPAVFDVKTTVPESTWETFGPTSSGMDNEWAALDQLPSSARILKVAFELQLQTTDASTLTANLKIAAAANGLTLNAGSENLSNLIDWQWLKNNIGTDSILQKGWFHADIPLNSSQEFQMLWTLSNEGGGGISMYYRGFMTD